MIGAIIGGVAGFANGIYGISRSNRELTRAFKKQMEVVMLNYNHNQLALTQEERYALDSAKQELFSLTLNGMQNNATVEAALAETGYEGRTAGKLMTSMAGQEERQKTAVRTAYYNDIAEIRSKKDALYIQTNRQIQQARDNLRNSYTTGLDALLSVGTSAAQGTLLGNFAGSVGSAMGDTSSLLEALNTVWDKQGKDYLQGLSLLGSIGRNYRGSYRSSFY